VLAVSAPVLCEPLTGLEPLQPPEAVQAVVFVELQVRFNEAPLLTLLCEALMDAVGAGEEVDVSPPPQDTSSNTNAAVISLRCEKCMPVPSFANQSGYQLHVAIRFWVLESCAIAARPVRKRTDHT
jgi:hypothetical protein